MKHIRRDLYNAIDAAPSEALARRWTDKLELLNQWSALPLQRRRKEHAAMQRTIDEWRRQIAKQNG